MYKRIRPTIVIAYFMCHKVCEVALIFVFFLQSNNYSWLPSTRVAWDVML